MLSVVSWRFKMAGYTGGTIDLMDEVGTPLTGDEKMAECSNGEFFSIAY